MEGNTDYKEGKIRVLQDGVFLYLILDDKHYKRIHYKTGMQVSKALLTISKMCEAEDMFIESSKDQALLDELGVPIQLASNEKAGKLIGLGSIDGKSIVGEPKIIVSNNRS